MGSDRLASFGRKGRAVAERTARRLRRTVVGTQNAPHQNAPDQREAVRLSVEWARFPMAEGDWAEAASRWEQVLDQFGPASSWSAHRGLIVAHTNMAGIEAAESAATRARAVFPDSVELAVAQAEIPMAEEQWQTAAARWEQLLDRFEPNVPPKAYVRAAVAHGKLGDLASAALMLDRGATHHPGHVALIANTAELAMTRRDWPDAVRRWNELLQARSAQADSQRDGSRFPRRGNQWDWYEEAWKAIARNWTEIQSQIGFVPNPSFFGALGRTLGNARLPDEELEILRVAMAVHPDDDRLAFDYAVARLGLVKHTQRSSELQSLRQELKDHPLLAEFCTDETFAVEDARPLNRSSDRGDLDLVAEVRAANAEAMATFVPDRGDTNYELGSVYIIRVPHGSSVELELKAGRYLSRDIIERRVREISERDAWEGITAKENPVFRQARELSDAFGQRFASAPLLPAEALSDAVLFLLVHEVSLYEPMERLAADIAAEADTSPVFIESPTDEYAYLDGYPFSHFDVLYLYFALRRRGANAFVCRLYNDTAPDPSSITFRPGVRSLLPSAVVEEPTGKRHSSAVIPAGIRSVRRVVETLDSPLVFSSGEVIEEPDYDRSTQDKPKTGAEISIHPEISNLPTFTFDLRTLATLRRVPVGPQDDSTEQATIEVSDAIGGDWFLWLDRALHTYLAAISANAHAAIASHGIEEAHVADHLFADASLFASAVKRNGGRVVLWPHSANPVHVNERRSGSFDEVHAVTRAGCDEWRRRFPDVEIIHSPSTMLDPPTREGRIDAAMPLSVIVFGGRSIYRHMPMLNQTLHEASHRTFFTGLQELQTRHAIDVYFKPRGRTGDEEMWLSEIVGATASWNRVLEHPKRLDLPNMLFVSISMGSSALLEGLSRGIPGCVVRDFPVRDYTTLDDKAIPTGPSRAMLDIVASCLRPGGYEQLLERELVYYAAELETGESP